MSLGSSSPPTGLWFKGCFTSVIVAAELLKLSGVFHSGIRQASGVEDVKPKGMLLNPRCYLHDNQVWFFQFDQPKVLAYLKESNKLKATRPLQLSLPYKHFNQSFQSIRLNPNAQAWVYFTPPIPPPCTSSLLFDTSISNDWIPY